MHPLRYRWLIILVLIPGVHRAMAAEKPNVLFIIVDDLNNHLGCYGDQIVKSPNIDRLATRGVRFDRAYCQYPVCNPSRSSFLSGLHPETTGVCAQNILLRKEKMPNVVYLPEHFRAHGYFTAGIGKIEHGGHHEIKWDVMDDIRGAGGEDEEEGTPKPTTRTRTRPGRRAATVNSESEVGRRMKGEGLPYTVERATENEDDPENADTLIAKKVVKLLESRKDGDKPFFIAAGFHKPHVPHVAPKRFFDMYVLEQMKLASVPADDAKDIPAIALSSMKNYQPDMPEETKRRIIRAYLACTTYMDEKVGEVMSAMDRLKLWDKTIVVLVGDHGWHFGEHNWWAKASLFEESARAPFIVVAPGAKANVACARVVEFLDVDPTLTELCGLPPMPQGEGKSFAPLLKDPQQSWDHVAYTALGMGPLGRSVRNERYRYTEWDQGRKGAELYDHQTDPQEFTNLAEDPKHKEVVEEMKGYLGKLQPRKR